jgi:hypothetical protein
MSYLFAWIGQRVVERIIIDGEGAPLDGLSLCHRHGLLHSSRSLVHLVEAPNVSYSAESHMRRSMFSDLVNTF